MLSIWVFSISFLSKFLMAGPFSAASISRSHSLSTSQNLLSIVFSIIFSILGLCFEAGMSSKSHWRLPEIIFVLPASILWFVYSNAKYDSDTILTGIDQELYSKLILLITPILSYMLFSVSRNRGEIFGQIMVFIGSLVISGLGSSPELKYTSTLANGLFYALISCFSLAGSLVWVQELLRTKRHLSFNLLSGLISFIPYLIVACIDESGPKLKPYSFLDWALILTQSVLPIVYSAGLESIEATHLTVLIVLGDVFANLVSYSIIHSYMAWTIPGILLILGGCFNIFTTKRITTSYMPFFTRHDPFQLVFPSLRNITVLLISQTLLILSMTYLSYTSFKPNFDHTHSEILKSSLFDQYTLLFENAGPFSRYWYGHDFGLAGKRLRLWKYGREVLDGPLSFQNARLTAKAVKDMEAELFPWIRPRFAQATDLEGSFYGEGIVICVPDRYVQDAISTLQMIRTVFNCTLPVEVFYVGEEDLSLNNRKALEEIPFTTTRNMNNIFDTQKLQVKGYGIKPFALLASSFQKAILIDADVIFFQSPEVLFRNEEFIENGALFYWDRQLLGDWDPLTAQQNYVRSLLPQPLTQRVLDLDMFIGTTYNTQESGVVVIDKAARFSGLMATCFLNVAKVRQESYKYMNGDKETFWIGFEIMDEIYIFNKYLSGPMGAIKSSNGRIHEICSTQILHLDRDRKPLWFNGGLYENKNTGMHGIIRLDRWMIGRGGEWKWYEGGGGCLTAETLPVLFNHEEKRVFGEIVKLFGNANIIQ